MTATDASSLMREASSPPPHWRQLDGLRAVAIFGVLVTHFSTLSGPWGGLGVRLFFGLSGFLITDILLRCREEAASRRGGWAMALRAFYARRALRIFPVFYFALIATAAVGIRPVRETFWWHASYLTNFHLVQRDGYHGPITHFWSLAVEEQFYLIWPCLVLMTPRRWLGPLIAVTILIGPAYRGFGAWWGLGRFAQVMLLPGCLDGLGMGAMLAWIRREGESHRFCRWCLIIGLPLSAAAWWLKAAWPAHVHAAAQYLGWALMFTWVIGRAVTGFGGPVGAVLESRPMVYLGKISYGVYVYHNFMPTVVSRLLRWDGLLWSSWGLPVLSAASIAAAAASWHLMEKPINRLKDRFPYGAKSRRPESMLEGRENALLAEAPQSTSRSSSG